MKIARISPITGLVNQIEIDVTNEQLAAWANGALIQNVMPHLEPWEREFIISGCTQDDWETMTEGFEE